MERDANEKRMYKIGEVCRIADLQPYVLRYWETEFPPLAPGKSGGGQRLYSQHEIDVILRIKQLLYAEGFTIAGAKKRLEAELTDGALAPRNADTAPPAARSDAPSASPAPPQVAEAIGAIRSELEGILRLLSK